MTHMAEIGRYQVNAIPAGREECLRDNALTELSWETVVRGSNKTIDALMSNSLLLGIRSIKGTATKFY